MASIPRARSRSRSRSPSNARISSDGGYSSTSSAGSTKDMRYSSATSSLYTTDALSAFESAKISTDNANSPSFVSPKAYSATPNLTMAADKANREVFVANTPPGVSEQNLVDFMNGAMQRTKLCPSNHNAVVHCRNTSNFAFVECASEEDANQALNLNGIPFMGVNIRVARPSKNVSSNLPSKTWQELTEPFKSKPIGSVMEDVEGKCTRVVELRNMLTVEDLESDEEYYEVMEETKEECSEFGTLKQIVMPRSGVGSTKIFLEYEKVEDAIKAFNALAGRTFDGRTIDAKYIDVEKFEKQDYSD